MKQKILGTIIIVLAAIITFIMVKMGKKDPKSIPQMKAPVVRVEKVTAANIQADIMATAIVEANQTLALTPEISGRVSWISPKLIEGGYVKKGEVLIRLDDRDASLAVKQYKVNVENAKLNLEQENARGEIAREEWKTLGDGSEASEMILRVPQAKVAELNLLSAESALKKAKLNLSRTKIKAPFNATISKKSVSVGQVVSPQAVLVRLLEVGQMRAEVTLPLDQIRWVDIPGVGGSENGSDVILIQKFGKGDETRNDGIVSALIGEIDQQTRRVRLNILIPYKKSDALPLLPGAFVEVHIKGKTVENALKIPREAITGGVNAWKVLDDSTLVKFDFNRLWGTSEHLVVKTANHQSINLALNLPQAPVNGMKVTPLIVNGGEDE